MRILPTNKTRKANTEPELTKVQIVTRVVALLVALISVFFFFFKILFF
ncbi:hypothetical protein DYBT9275_02125 [Dyadobacter sp. CECT 9275]|uniref:Uncharacterized protein n=1 Tax=Dyadobacter helix TaxID=2822344 RepID=A0A916JBJ7_9BACT|nr:hypothetical protein [Dyadobacter sp. CECT 9275]CAG4998987.1 hypothetical protein DYBT9275_02125 [Dyadobacter sp. CECT 9275]